MNSYKRILDLIIEHQFSRGTKAPRMLAKDALVKKNYGLMKQHQDLVKSTGRPQHPATQKALSAHIEEFLFRKAKEKGEPFKRNRKRRNYPPRKGWDRTEWK